MSLSSDEWNNMLLQDFITVSYSVTMFIDNNQKCPSTSSDSCPCHIAVATKCQTLINTWVRVTSQSNAMLMQSIAHGSTINSSHSMDVACTISCNLETISQVHQPNVSVLMTVENVSIVIQQFLVHIKTFSTKVLVETSLQHLNRSKVFLFVQSWNYGKKTFVQSTLFILFVDNVNERQIFDKRTNQTDLNFQNDKGGKNRTCSQSVQKTGGPFQ